MIKISGIYPEINTRVDFLSGRPCEISIDIENRCFDIVADGYYNDFLETWRCDHLFGQHPFICPDVKLRAKIKVEDLVYESSKRIFDRYAVLGKRGDIVFGQVVQLLKDRSMYAGIDNCIFLKQRVLSVAFGNLDNLLSPVIWEATEEIASKNDLSRLSNNQVGVICIPGNRPLLTNLNNDCLYLELPIYEGFDMQVSGKSFEDYKEDIMHLLREGISEFPPNIEPVFED